MTLGDDGEIGGWGVSVASTSSGLAFTVWNFSCGDNNFTKA